MLTQCCFQALVFSPVRRRHIVRYDGADFVPFDLVFFGNERCDKALRECVNRDAGGIGFANSRHDLRSPTSACWGASASHMKVTKAMLARLIAYWADRLVANRRKELLHCRMA